MNPKEIYKIWAPSNIKWSAWVRPVPFINLGTPKALIEKLNFELPNINYLDNFKENTAIIIDIEGEYAIKEGIKLIDYGYRPIPIFNGTEPNLKSKGTTDNSIIEPYLIWGSTIIKNSEISDNALPAFLLDSNRLKRFKINRGIFDNSWDIYPQDITTPKYLLDNNINKILVRSNKLNIDLEKVLYKFYKNNIDIYITDGLDEPRKIIIKKPKKIEL